jgi:hypothetical protein
MRSLVAKKSSKTTPSSSLGTGTDSIPGGLANPLGKQQEELLRCEMRPFITFDGPKSKLIPARAASTPIFTRLPLSEVFPLSPESSDTSLLVDPASGSEVTSIEAARSSLARDASNHSVKDSLCSTETISVSSKAINEIPGDIVETRR